VKRKPKLPEREDRQDISGGENPARELAAFERLRRCLIDSSSAICMQKAGFLTLLCETIELATIPEVVAETGFDDLPALVLTASSSEKKAYAAEKSPTVDELLVEQAVTLRLPVITEDRKMMLRLDREGVPFFNALMMLHLLLYRGKLDLPTHTARFDRLLAVSRYSDRVRAYGDEVLQAVLKFR